MKPGAAFFNNAYLFTPSIAFISGDPDAAGAASQLIWPFIILLVIFAAALFVVHRLLVAKIRKYYSKSVRDKEVLSEMVNEFRRRDNNLSREMSDYKKSMDTQLQGALDAITKLQKETALVQQSNPGNVERGYVRYGQDEPAGERQLPSRPEPEQQKRNEDVFYASIPDADGSFSLRSITSSISPSASFYKFSVNGKDSAKFEFLNDERAIQDASNSPEIILFPVCKVIGAINQRAKSIKTIKPGRVIKIEGSWQLDTKAEISYV